MDTKQMMALEWMDGVEQYAREKRLSMRIIDGIEVCRKKMAAENADWKEISLMVTDLLDSIEQKTVPAAMEEKREGQISIQAIEEQVRKMAQKCHSENQASVGNIVDRKNLVVKKIYNDLREITHTKAHLEELKDQNAYLQFFVKMKSEYEKNALQMIRELLQDISGNYDHLIEHIKSMFQSIGGHKYGIGSEKIYYEYDSQRENLNNRFQNEVVSMESGGNEITDLGQETAETVKKTVKKLTVIRKILAWVPLLLLLIGLAIGAVTTHEENIEVIESVQIEDLEDGEHSDVLASVKKQLAERAKKEIENASASEIKLFLSKVMNYITVLFITLGIALLAILLVIIVLYAAYLRILRIWCNNQICKECRKYLTTELNRFEQSGTLVSRLDDAVTTTVEQYEQEYLVILNQVFSGTAFDTTSDDQKERNRFAELRETWSKIVYE